jgi:hypothetical protein
MRASFFEAEMRFANSRGRSPSGAKRVLGHVDWAQALDQSVNIDWEQAKLDCFDRISLKSYNSAVPTESAIFCILELHKIHPFDPAEVVSIEADVVQDTYDFTGGGRFGPKTNVHTCWRLPCLMAMFRRHSSSPNGLRSQMSKTFCVRSE